MHKLCSVVFTDQGLYIWSFFIFTVAPKINVPPRFRDTAFFDKGENAVIKIPFIGNPRPRITWQREGETIESGGHYSVETQQRHAILTLRDVNNLDTGSYRLTAENELGSDSVIIKIQISGTVYNHYQQHKTLYVCMYSTVHYNM